MRTTVGGIIFVLLCGLPLGVLWGGEVAVWAVGELVRINPETGKAFEDNPRQLPGGLAGDYRSKNTCWSASDRTVRLAGARNEVLAFQVIVEGKAGRVELAASSLRGPEGALIPVHHVKLFREWYVHLSARKPERSCMAPLGPGWFPDVAIPLSDKKYGNGFSIPSKDFHDLAGAKFPAQKNQAVWVDLHVPPKAPPGKYEGNITVTADGKAHALRIQLRVLNFTIPSEMNMFAELMNYGGVVREKDRAMTYNYFKLAHEHRTVISDNKVRPKYNGTDYAWGAFDEKYGKLFDGSLFTEGPTAGVPIPYWTFPLTYHITRPDKRGKKTKSDWPVASPKTPTGYGVEFTDQFKKNLSAAMKKWEEHFVKKGWTKTRQGIFQNCLDEPGFHKGGKGLKAGAEQARAIHGTAKLVKESGLKLLFYKLDIGGGNSRCHLDLDGNGKKEGPVDVANYLGSVVKMFSIHGLCINVPALEPWMKKSGAEAIFYNGYHPRVGPNTIDGELLGLRTWGVAAWRSGLAGWADWQFRLETGSSNVFYRPTRSAGKNLYFYRGEHIGRPGKLFASLRLKSMRRGAQDYELLRLLARKDGNGRRAQAIASLVCGAGFKEIRVEIKDFKDDVDGVDHPYAGVDKKAHWSHDPAAWQKFRHALERALKGKNLSGKP